MTLSTQAQTYGAGESAANFYNNPYFNPYGIPAPQQAVPPTPRPAGLFGESAQRNQSDRDYDRQNTKHKADFVPITPSGMEARSPYKQRDDFRLLWRGALKDSASLGTLSENARLIEQLGRMDVGLPSESSRGNFNISSRQVEALFKSASIDRRAFPEVRKVQTELVQSYYRYLSAYNKFALAEQNVAARQQEVDLSDSDLERQRATADLSQAKNDRDSSKDDMHSAEMELASASSPTAARSVISRIAGVAPSVESLAQGCSRNANRAQSGRMANIFSVFKHPHDQSVPQVADNDSSDNIQANADNQSRGGSIFSRSKAKDKNKSKKNIDSDDLVASKPLAISSKKNPHRNADSDADDLAPAPASRQAEDISSRTNSDDAPASELQVDISSTGNHNISFLLKNVSINPRKSVLTVAVRNSGSQTFELNPDAICISEGNHRLAQAAMRADFDVTSIEPNHEVKGTITVFGRPWNDKLMIYLNDGPKTIALKR